MKTLETDTMSLQDFKQECRARWKEERFFEKDCSITEISEDGDWVPYEAYMLAQFVRAVPGEIGILNIKFPPESSEDNRHHIHPCSDRKITVLKGNGSFEYFKNSKLQIIPLEKGDRIWMPRGIIHTFRSDRNGLMVESVHSPFLEFDHPHFLVYPKSSSSDN